MAKYLDESGLKTVWAKIKETFAKVSDLPTKASQLENDAGYLTEHQDISGKADAVHNHTMTQVTGLVDRIESIETSVTDVKTALNAETVIRANADNSEKVTRETTDQVLTEIVDYATSLAQEAKDGLSAKQDNISDLETIRSGAELGATALQEVPTATDSVIGGVKVNSSYGIAKNSGGTIYINKATDAEINARTSEFKPITPANGDYFVKAALCDGKGAAYSDDEALAARTRLKAMLDPTWELIATYDGDGETKKFVCNEELIHLYITVIVDANVSVPIIGINAYNSATVKDKTTRLMYTYLSASNQSYKRKAMSRLTKFGNMYHFETSGYISNTNTATLYRLYYENVDDIISDENEKTIEIAGNSEIPVGVQIKLYGVRA